MMGGILKPRAVNNTDEPPDGVVALGRGEERDGRSEVVGSKGFESVKNGRIQQKNKKVQAKKSKQWREKRVEPRGRENTHRFTGDRVGEVQHRPIDSHVKPYEVTKKIPSKYYIFGHRIVLPRYESTILYQKKILTR